MYIYIYISFIVVSHNKKKFARMFLQSKKKKKNRKNVRASDDLDRGIHAQ